jgi:hypothetical protein
MVINNKENETLYVDEAKGDKPTDSGLSHKKRTGRRRGTLRRSSTTTATSSLHQGTTTTRPQKQKWLIKTILLIILVCPTIRMHIYCLFLLENPFTLMEKIILSRVIKCVVIYSLYILVSGK